MTSGATVKVHVTGDPSATRDAIRDLPAPLRALVGGEGAVSVEPLSTESDLYKKAFGAQLARARTSQDGSIFLEQSRFQAVGDLRSVLLHELCHVAQMRGRKPIGLPAWPWLLEPSYYVRRCAGLMNIIATRAGLSFVAEGGVVGQAANRLGNLFLDADVYAFLLGRGVIPILDYAETLRGHLRDLATHEGGDTIDLDALWEKNRTLRLRNPQLVAATAWGVFVEWLLVPVNRWARLGPLVSRSDAAAIVDQYIRSDTAALATHFGSFRNDEVFDRSWKELAAADYDENRTWLALERLAISAVREVKAHLSPI